MTELAKTLLALAFAAVVASAAQAQPGTTPQQTLECFDSNEMKKRYQVAGGTDANVRAYPYIVKLLTRLNGNSYECGGSLVGQGWVLTAAHCVTDSSKNPVEPGFVLPAQNVTVARPGEDGTGSGPRRGASHIFVNPGWDWDKMDFDVALIRLDAEYAADQAAPVTLADAQLDAAFASGGECARVAGWGRTDVLDSNMNLIKPGPQTSVLQELNISVLSHASCKARYPANVNDQMLCGGDGIEGKNTCSGDSGGPLVVDVGAVPVQVGLVSWAFGCAQENHYTVFTRTGSQVIRDWMMQVVQGQPQ